MGRWRWTAGISAVTLAVLLCPLRGNAEISERFLKSAREYLESRKIGEIEIFWELEETNGEESESASSLADDPNVTIVPEMRQKLEEALKSGETLDQKTGRSETSQETEIAFQGIQKVFNYLFVGDSRFVGMESAVGNGEASWICETSMGLDWLRDSAAPLIDEMELDGYAIVLNLGVNDLYRASDYVSFLNEKIPAWRERGASVYYMCVNPVSAGASVTNDEIAAFNQTIYDNLPPGTGWIDTMNYLIEDGFSAPDGLHYDDATYRKIYDYAMEAVKGED